MKKEIITLIYNRTIDTFIDRYGINRKEYFTAYDLHLNVCSEIAKIKADFPQYEEIVMKGEYEYGYYDSCEYMISFFGKRFETEEEYNKRMETNENRAEAARKAALTKKKLKEEKDLALYQELKKQFEK